MDKKITLGARKLDHMNISINNYIPVSSNVVTKCTNLRIDIDCYKCKKLKSLKQCLTATRPTSHN